MIRKIEYDTETGLPRKTLTKLGIWAIGLLQVMAVTGIGVIWNKVDDMSTRLSRLEGKVGMSAAAQGPSLAVQKHEPVEPTP